MRYPIRVLFLCTGNSACSQMAEGLLRSFGGGNFEVYSAGTDPKTVCDRAQKLSDLSGRQRAHPLGVRGPGGCDRNPG